MERRTVRLCPCGTRLARDNRASRCARCQKAARDLCPPEVPAAFWDTPEMRQALATWHMGQVIRAYRTHPYHGEPIPQAVAGRWINLTQTQLSRLENGPAPDSLIKLTHWARIFAVRPDLLWFQMPEEADGLGSTPAPLATAPSAEDEPWQVNPYEPAPSGLDDMNRRELLRLLAMAGPLVGAADLVDWQRLELGSDRPRGVDGATLDEYAALNTHLWRVFVLSRSKPAVFPLVRSHLDTLTATLQQSQGTEAQARLCLLAADLFQLAGEICFDANRYTEAAHSYTLAASACREADDFDLWACALTRHAFIAVHERQFDKAAPLLELAARLARRGDHMLSTRHWVAAVQAQAFAGLGDLDACKRALDLAEEVHGLDGPVHNGGWLRFDGSRLAEERGTCYVALRRPDLAEAALTTALDNGLSARRRGSVLVDLALIGVQRGDPDQLVTYAGAALDTARQTGSGYLGRKLLGLRDQLEPLRGNHQVRQLAGEISAVVGL